VAITRTLDDITHRQPTDLERMKAIIYASKHAPDRSALADIIDALGLDQFATSWSRRRTSGPDPRYTRPDGTTRAPGCCYTCGREMPVTRNKSKIQNLGYCGEKCAP